MAIQEQISKLEAGSASYAEKTTVVGQPDVPGLSTREMQDSVEYKFGRASGRAVG